ncbi:MAG: alcohol dehydrogenase catalytic domain-containing protein, partial [Trueperaceae bacterium]|nr:alcohol dehydrogenase catalytic domain-containing protein [Trueperaceae bacterium]
MRSVLLEAPGRLVLQEVPEPTEVGPGEALVRVLRVGVCGSDLHAFNGRQAFMRYPIVLGHELAVEVLAVGPDAPGAQADAAAAVVGVSDVPAKAAAAVVGDRCTVVPYLSCGTCQACRVGRTNCCERLQLLGIHVDGGLRERFVLPRAALLVANDVDVDALALVEMLAVGLHASRRAAVAAHERVLVLGAGPIGLATMAFLAPSAAATWTFDLDARRAAFAASALGVRALPVDSAAAVPTPDERLAGVRRAFGGDLPDVVV